MSKIVPLLIGGTGLAAASYGGYVLFKGKGTGKGEQEKSVPQQAAPTQGGATQGGNTPSQPNSPKASSTETLLFDSVSSFQTKAKASPCISTHFGSNFSITGGEDLGGEHKPKDGETFFKTEGEKATQSCLIINWTKQSQDKKWTGKFTWLWTFVKGEEGFISFNVAEPSTDEGKLKFTGAFYLVEKGADNQKGTVKYKKEVTGDEKKVENDKLDEYFPKAGSDLKSVEGVGGDYGGFIDSKDELSELCKKGECEKATATTKKFHWLSKNDENKKLKDGTTGLGGWDKIFDTNNFGKLEDKIKEFKGKGELQTN